MRSLSNLIKSGRVIDIGTPVNIGVSYTINEANHIILEKSTTSKVIKKEVTASVENNVEPEEVVSQATISKEEIMEQYIKEAEAQAKAQYDAQMQKAFNEGIEKAKHEAESIIEQAKAEYENILDEIVKIKEDAINEDAVNRVVNKKDVTVRLSTQDYYTIQANKKLLVSKIKGFGEIELIQDESLDMGSCIVDTPLGVIDGGLQVRMDNIQREIKKMLSE